MKLFKRIHLIRIIQIPIQAISSAYFSSVLLEFNDEKTARDRAIGFEVGYKKALEQAGIKPKDYPRAARD